MTSHVRISSSILHGPSLQACVALKRHSLPAACCDDSVLKLLLCCIHPCWTRRAVYVHAEPAELGSLQNLGNLKQAACLQENASSASEWRTDARLVPIHPLAPIRLSHLQGAAAFPFDLPLEPKDSLSLYDHLHDVLQEAAVDGSAESGWASTAGKDLHRLNPEVYFASAPNHCMMRSSSRQYEAELKDLLRLWAYNGGEPAQLDGRMLLHRCLLDICRRCAVLKLPGMANAHGATACNCKLTLMFWISLQMAIVQRLRNL